MCLIVVFFYVFSQLSIGPDIASSALFGNALAALLASSHRHSEDMAAEASAMTTMACVIAAVIGMMQHMRRDTWGVVYEIFRKRYQYYLLVFLLQVLFCY